MRTDKRNSRRREHYRENIERRRADSRAQMAAWRKRNPEESRRRSRDASAERHETFKGRAHEIFRAAQRRAKIKGIEFELTEAWVLERISQPCEATGLQFVIGPRGSGRSPRSPSIDRKHNSKGYTRGNCRLIVWGLNAALATWGHDDYVSIARAYLTRES